jgi:hypothetical protein
LPREQTGRPGAALFARRAQSDGFGFCVMEFDDGAKPLCLNLRPRLVSLGSVFWLLFLIPLVCQKRAEDYSNGFLMVFVFNFKSSSCWSIFLRPVFFFSLPLGMQRF